MPYIFDDPEMAPANPLPRFQALEAITHENMARMRSPEDGGRSAELKIKNRRKRYLELHPEYFGPNLELADPLLYDRLIRRFQTAAEREAEGREKGLAEILMSDFLRIEARNEALRNPSNPYSMFSYARGPDGQILPEEPDEVPQDKEEGRSWWVDEMTQRFLTGKDKEFDYKAVDENDKYDDPEEERDIEEAYFDSMEPEWDGPERELKCETGIQDY
ncbi:hypothetical protein GQ43DRAFT_237628 [Delitschia confertaspora ATCC 74209]|uniref:CCD97-like C-terminal domain-containing protein n=1 Tax=Delitschia confertaspora ATCC 74209 TaxID=1513339 RepID=A0A9P4JFA3_9PLEO|nr:hypothetical protein GQ43DRAFT_237628 [Delitschia confertaspora ATCC 74209]